MNIELIGYMDIETIVNTTRKNRHNESWSRQIINKKRKKARANIRT